MVKARDINKDIKAISEKVGVAVFAYEDIFHPKVKNEFHYDFEKVIAECANVKKISHEEAEKNLIEAKVLKPLPNGEYKIDVGESTRNGGGINYSEVFFSFNQSDYRTKYHELAHSLQDKYDLFNEENVQKQYDAAGKGLSDEQKKDLLADKGDYNHYLKEMHSESFSYAAMMLRSSNSLDFIRQMSAAYNAGSVRNLLATIDFGEPEYGSNSLHSSKFYATRPVMKATIKAIKKIRKEGKVNEFFDEKGVIRDEKLARLCENIVLDSAYSPRTLNSFFKHKIFDKNNKTEHRWRTDAIKSVVHAPVSVVMYCAHEAPIFDTIRKIADHAILKKITDKKINKYTKTPNKCHNQELQALKEYERLQSKITQIDDKFPNEYIPNRINARLPYIAEHYVPDAVLRDMANEKMEKSTSASDFYKDLVELNKIIELNRSNPYFKQLLQSKPETNVLHSMIKEKQNNPQKEVIAEHNLHPKIRRGYATFGIQSNMNKLNNFAKKHKISSDMHQSLLNTMINKPELLKYNTTRKKLSDEHQIKGNFLGFKKRKFDKELNQLLDSMCANHYYNQDNPKYKETIAELRKIPQNENFIKAEMEKITELGKSERAEREAHNALRKKVFSGLENMEKNIDAKNEDYYKACTETVKAFASLDKDERKEILDNQLPKIKETLKPLLANLPEKALSQEAIANLKIDYTEQTKVTQEERAEEKVKAPSDDNLSKEPINEPKKQPQEIGENNDNSQKQEQNMRTNDETLKLNPSLDIDKKRKEVEDKLTSNQQSNPFAISPANSAPQADSTDITCDKVADMPQEQKFKFFFHLRRGVNLITAKREGGFSSEKSAFTTNNNQQMTQLQKMMMKDKSNGM